jgi:hypothetical protein
MKPHKHALFIKAWADGAQIQVLDNHMEWQDIGAYSSWHEESIYRVKPESKPDINKIFRLESNPFLGLRFQDHQEPLRPDEQYIKVTFNDGIIKSAEVLK